VVSATVPHGRNLGFLDPEPLLFHSSSSSVMLTRLSGSRSRPTTSGLNLKKLPLSVGLMLSQIILARSVFEQS
jgi:hypothetical protein